MNKYEILFKKSRRARKVQKWERFSDDIQEVIRETIDKIKENFFVESPVILSVREIPYYRRAG